MIALLNRHTNLHGPALLAAVLCFALVFVALRDTSTVAELRQEGPVETIELTFFDVDGGIVEARRATDGLVLAQYTPGQGGFVRQTMRGFAIERRKADVAPAEPFELARMATGHLLLSDPTTGRVVALDAFGQTNAGDFAGMLNRGRETR